MTTTKIRAGLLIAGLIIGVVAGYGTGFTEISKLQTNLTTTRSKVTSLESQVTDLSSQLDADRKQVSELETQLETKINQLDELQTKIRQKETEITNLKSQITSLKTQITSLNTEIDKLVKLIPPYTKGAWNVLKTFTGAVTRSTELFYIPFSDLRITWVLQAEGECHFSIFLYNEKGNFTAGCPNLQSEPKGETYIHALSVGNYYLDFWAMYVKNYTVTIDVWVPE